MFTHEEKQKALINIGNGLGIELARYTQSITGLNSVTIINEFTSPEETEMLLKGSEQSVNHFKVEKKESELAIQSLLEQMKRYIPDLDKTKFMERFISIFQTSLTHPSSS